VAVAAIPDGQGIIHGCCRKPNGTLGVIDKAKGQHCVTGERAIGWNERGRRGRRGPRGLQGPQGIQGEPGDSTLGLDYLAASSVLNDDPASHSISFTIPQGTVLRTFWYRVRITTPTGPCDALPEADSIVGNHEMNGGSPTSPHRPRGPSGARQAARRHPGRAAARSALLGLHPSA
jgi:hypothetical protein